MAADWEGSLEGLIETKDVELPPLSGLEGFTIETPEAEGDGSEGTAAEVSLVPKPATDSPAAEKPEASAKVEKKPAASSGQDKTEAGQAEGESSSLAQNMVLLGIAGFALLAGMTILMRKKQ